MKYLDEYRDPELVRGVIARIRTRATKPWVIMEVCGGQTHSIVRYGLDRLLPPQIELVHGPGCPVCVTPLEIIDRAHAIARLPNVIFTSFGDMLRVPGSRGDLLAVRAEGADVRFVYSPIDALEIARQNPDKEVVFFGIGFETTAPANAFAVFQAHSTGLKNFSMLVSQVLVPPAIESLLEAPGNRVQGFLGPGHVCSVMGFRDYEELAGRYRTPIVVTGFEPVDLLEGVLRCVEQLEQGLSLAENQYARSVHADGNAAARAMVERVFETVDRKWRGLGLIPRSGYGIRREYRDHDAEHRFEVRAITTSESKRCISGLVLQGRKKPCDCPAFGVDCKPESPLGATMVSSEGACRAYFAHGRHRELSDAV